FDVPLMIILYILLPHFFPSFIPPNVKSFSESFYKLSHKTHEVDEHGSVLYTKGRLDFRFVSFYVLIIIFARALCFRYVFLPITRLRKIIKKEAQDRFCEQAWFSLYYSTFFSLGFYLLYHSPYYFNTPNFWADYPHIRYTAVFKSYYLLQLSFSIAQLVVLHLEKPRKDYTQFLVHHIVTIMLVSLSYYMNFIRIGHAVFVTMDFADIFLSTAKCLRYLKFQKACDFTFVVFVLSWIYSRHFVYLYIVRSIFVDVIAVIDPVWDPKNEIYLSYGVATVFMILFVGLKILICYWAYLIGRIVVKVIKGKGGAEDNRSDNEDD
ncbi:TLC domain-containing protein, partial [Paraphysoderma sedebokerense]